jgi:hypothetical protein
LLPGSAYQSADNPLQPDRLGDISKVELDYPVFQDAPRAAQRRTVVVLLATTFAATVLSWFSQIVPIPFLDGGLNTVVLLAAGFLTVVGILAPRFPSIAVIAAIAVLPVLAALVRDVPFSLAALTFALLALPVMANALATNYLYLKTAAPTSRHDALDIRAKWRKRWRPWSKPLLGSELYVLNLLVLLPVTWLAVTYIATYRGTAGRLALFSTIGAIGLVWAIVADIIVAILFRRRILGVHRQIAALWRAVVEWTTYNRLNTFGAGVHQSPAGRSTTRRFLLIGLLLAWACVWVGVEIERPTNIFDRFALVQNALQTERAMEDAQLYANDNESPLKHYKYEDRPDLSQEENAFLKTQTPEFVQNYLTQKGLGEHPTESAIAKQKAQQLLSNFLEKLSKIVLFAFGPILATLIAAGFLVLALAGRSLAGIEALLGSNWRTRVLSMENWHTIVDRIESSQDEVEKHSIFMGTNALDDSPVLVPRDTFKEHAHILGDSGSGKTSMGILPLVTQLMRRGDCSVLVIDLKADDQLVFECLRNEAARISHRLCGDNTGYPFRWFTTAFGKSSFAFNPMIQSVMGTLTIDQRADLLQASLGLHYGTDYGRKFYGDANYEMLNYALHSNPNADSFAALEKVLEGSDRFPLHAESKKAGSNVRSSIRRLARLKALNACPATGASPEVMKARIELADLFTSPQAVYVGLPAGAGISITAEVARLFLYSLLAAAQVVPKPRHQVFVVVDEFQRIVSKNIELLLQQARSMNVGCILSNQSLSDLDSVDADLIDAVRTNTRFRQVFGAGSRSDIFDLIDTGGETVFGLRSWNLEGSLFGATVKDMSVSETRRARLSVNDILLATDAPGRNIACVRRGMGYAQYGGMPFVIDSVFHLNGNAHREFSDAPWPRLEDHLLVATIDESVRTTDSHSARVLDPSPQTDKTDSKAEGEEAAATAVADAETDPIDELYWEQVAENDALRKRMKKDKRRRPEET